MGSTIWMATALATCLGFGAIFARALFYKHRAGTLADQSMVGVLASVAFLSVAMLILMAIGQMQAWLLASITTAALVVAAAVAGRAS